MSDGGQTQTSSLMLLTHCRVVYSGLNECVANEVLYKGSII